MSGSVPYSICLPWLVQQTYTHTHAMFEMPSVNCLRAPIILLLLSSIIANPLLKHAERLRSKWFVILEMRWHLFLQPQRGSNIAWLFEMMSLFIEEKGQLLSGQESKFPEACERVESIP